MFKIRLFTYLCIGAVCILSGCHRQDSSETMAFDNISFVTEFPRTFESGAGMNLDLGLIGVRSLVVRDSLLIVSTVDANGFWSFFKLPDHTPMGSFLIKGRGGDEVLESPRVGLQSFAEQDGELCSFIYDFYTGKLLKMNISRTLKENSLDISRVAPELKQNLFNVVRLDSLTYFCREVSADFTKQDRYILQEGRKVVPDMLAILNEASVVPGKDINILGSYYGYNSLRNIMAEASMGLNIINLYSMDAGRTQKTICEGDRLYSIADAETVDRRQSKVTFCGITAFDDFFAVLYYGDTEENVHYGKAGKQRLQFFSWEGLPLAELALDKPANSFDIDFSRNILYTLNYDTDEIIRYDIGSLLSYLDK